MRVGLVGSRGAGLKGGKGERVGNACWLSYPIVSLGHQITISIAWWLKAWHLEVSKSWFKSWLCSFLTVLSLKFPIGEKGMNVDPRGQGSVMAE